MFFCAPQRRFLIVELENSTPSPPERRPYNYSQPQHFREDISEYEDDYSMHVSPQQFQPPHTYHQEMPSITHRPVFGSSSNRALARPFVTPSTVSSKGRRATCLPHSNRYFPSSSHQQCLIQLPALRALRSNFQPSLTTLRPYSGGHSLYTSQ